MNIPDAVLQRIVAAIPGGVLASTDQDQVFEDPQIPVYDGIIPKNPPARYVIVYIGTGTLAALGACGQHDSVTVRWQITSVASDGGQLRWLAAKARDNSVDTTPVATGWSCGPIEYVYGTQPDRDETVAERPVVYQADQYKVLATRA